MPDIIDGGDGDDRIDGAAGADRLSGGKGADLVLGGSGNDAIDGGAGNDELIGGDGVDSYRLGWGMGKDVLRETAVGSSTLLLDPGLGFNDVVVSAGSSDLVVRLKGTDDGVVIENYVTDTHDWFLEDASGASVTLATLLHANNTETIDSLVEEYVGAQKSKFFSDLSDRGYELQPDGSYAVTTVSSSPGLIKTTNSTARFDEIITASDDMAITRDSYVYSWVNLLVDRSSSQRGVLTASPGSSRIGRFTGWQYSSDGSLSLQTIDPGNSQFVEIRSDSGSLGIGDSNRSAGFWVGNTSGSGGSSSTGGLGISTVPVTYEQWNTGENLALEHMIGGAADNIIAVSNVSVARGGEGDDVLTVVKAKREFTQIFAATEWKPYPTPARFMYENISPFLNPGAFLSGDGGNDILIGSDNNDTLIGGDGVDVLDGRDGADSYHVLAGRQGVDFIIDTGGVNGLIEAPELNRYANWYYRDQGVVDYDAFLETLYDTATIPQSMGLPPNIPRHDYTALQPLYDADVVAKDVVSFGAGIQVSDISVRYGNVIPQDLGLSLSPGWRDLDTVHVTLDISVNGGGTARIVIPHSLDVLEDMPDSPFDFPDLDEPESGEEEQGTNAAMSALEYLQRVYRGLGLGVEEFHFADGTVLNMNDMLALAGPAPSFDPHTTNPFLGDNNANVITGDDDDNALMGFGGDDVLNGGPGADSLDGGSGNDSYIVDNVGDTVIERADHGVDIIESSIDYALGDNVENLMLTGEASLQGTGNALDNVIIGNAGNSVLSGAGGNDRLEAGSGSHQLFGDAGNDVLVAGALASEGNITFWAYDQLHGGAGDDELIGSDKFAALHGDEGDDVLRGGSGYSFLDGGVGQDTLHAGSGWNALKGGEGADLMVGGSGNTTFFVDNVSDRVEGEMASGGNDTVVSTIDYVLGDHLENLFLQGDQAISGTGNGLDNRISGASNAAANRLVGGLGDDYYIIDENDIIVEAAGEGRDTVAARFSYTLSAELENLVLNGTDHIDGTGTSRDNEIRGNSRNNVLRGRSGDDRLIGGWGSDRLVGGTGIDTMEGGYGNDVFIVENAGDVVMEGLNAGNDRVVSAIDYTLPDNVEKLTLSGVAGISGSGNSLSNSITGNQGSNILHGEDAHDTLDGKDGNDELYGDTGNDTLIAGRGTDFLFGGDGNDTLIGGASTNDGDFAGGADYLYGEGGDDTLTAGSKATLLSGGDGNDTLTGGSGRFNYLLGGAGDDVLTATGDHWSSLNGGNGNDRLSGAAGDDTLNAGDGNDFLDGGAGNDSLAGGAGSDLYVFNRGGGSDHISDYNLRDADPVAYGVTTDSLEFGHDIAHDQLWFTRDDQDLLVSVIGTADQVKLLNWYQGEAYQPDQLLAGDGQTLLNDQVDQLVQAMAAFDPPVAGELNLSPDLRNQLEPTLAVSWG